MVGMYATATDRVLIKIKCIYLSIFKYNDVYMHVSYITAEKHSSVYDFIEWKQKLPHIIYY